MTGTQILKAEDHRVGVTVTMTQGTFNKLLKLTGPLPKFQEMDAWSDVVTGLIERAK